MRKRIKAFILCILIVLATNPIVNLHSVSASDDKISLWIEIRKIVSIDSLKSIGDPFEFVDWHYYVSVLDSGVRYSVNSSFVDCFEEKYVNEMHKFQVQSRYVRIYIDLVDEDILSRPDLADISGHPGGGKDNYEDFHRDARFTAIYDVKTDRLIDNDEVTQASGYYVTSGDYDGSVNVDENDAELWFRVWDDYEVPTADVGPDKFCHTGEEVTFDEMGSVASNGSSIVKYEWDLDGDGEFEALGATQTLTFNTIGRYSVALRVTDTLGETAVDTCEVYVEEAPPVASFTVYPEEPTVREAVHFTDTSTVYRGDIRAWRWDFGDGDNSTEQSPTHLYPDKGTYLVSLTVEDDSGRVNTSSAAVTVVNLPPIASFTFSPKEPMKGADVRFSDESMDPEGVALLYEWDFGDGHTSRDRDPVHGYAEAGTYTVRLTVEDDEGEIGAASKILSVTQRYGLTLVVRDLFGLPISNAKVSIYSGGACIASEATDESGVLDLVLPEGLYEVKVKNLGLTSSVFYPLTGSTVDLIRVPLSFTTLGLASGVVAVLSLLGLYMTRRGSSSKREKVGKPSP